MAKTKLDTKALGYSLAILSGLCMLILGILGNLGFAAKAVEIMQAFHMGFSLTAGGIIIGIIEALAFGFITGYLIAYIYNKLV